MQKNLKRDNRAPMSADAGMKNGGVKAVKNLRMLRFRIVGLMDILSDEISAID